VLYFLHVFARQLKQQEGLVENRTWNLKLAVNCANQQDFYKIPDIASLF
jgi:hypothetical protein